MAIGQRGGAAAEELLSATIPELYGVLGENDTPFLYAQPYKVDVAHDVPMGAGNSIDRKTIYIDRGLYAEVMDNEFKDSGLNPDQIIDRWCDHEHTEICICYGNNLVDTYAPAHQRALRMEHNHVLAIVGYKDGAAKIQKYEEVIWPGLLRAYHRRIVKPPLDLWCSPHLDDPEPRDEEILEELRRLKVFDASKQSKYHTRYGAGEQRCRACGMWNPERVSQSYGELAFCNAVSGLVRTDRHCDLWIPKEPPVS